MQENLAGAAQRERLCHDYVPGVRLQLVVGDLRVRSGDDPHIFSEQCGQLGFGAAGSAETAGAEPDEQVQVSGRNHPYPGVRVELRSAARAGHALQGGVRLRRDSNRGDFLRGQLL